MLYLYSTYQFTAVFYSYNVLEITRLVDVLVTFTLHYSDIAYHFTLSATAILSNIVLYWRHKSSMSTIHNNLYHENQHIDEWYSHNTYFITANTNSPLFYVFRNHYLSLKALSINGFCRYVGLFKSILSTTLHNMNNLKEVSACQRFQDLKLPLMKVMSL